MLMSGASSKTIAEVNSRVIPEYTNVLITVAETVALYKGEWLAKVARPVSLEFDIAKCEW